ncbi:MAG TPA: trehalase family glycosidase [Candidatus Saccharimonadales bacterium]|nr:trehalase family glycosidase [Candidatus Saccharimonadales bacterium]
MFKEPEDKFIRQLARVLKQNDKGKWTVPAEGLYPHQWLWDSCFIAIGLRHLSIDRAKAEINRLLSGQWSNGMVPHMILSKDSRDRQIERGYLSPYSPDGVDTSGITQPPMLAEAVTKIGQKLSPAERRTWYRQTYPRLLAHHEWLYRERNPHGEGLIVLLHPYECGLDNTPPWISELRKHSMPLWISAIERLHLDKVVNLIRRDTKHVPPGQRMSNIEAMAYWSAMRRLRRKAYNSEAILSRSLFLVEDLAFNCVFIRANELLAQIAEDIGQDLPTDLKENIKKSRAVLEQLWDERQNEYFSRSFISHKLIEESTIAGFLPLYAGAVSKERAEQLVKKLGRKRTFGTRWPVPSVPINSNYFDEHKYWQGPTWINTNWLIIEGLTRYGYKDESKVLREKTIELVEKSGSYEYFSPLDGSPAGAKSFSWTAALTIDLLHH